MSMRYPGGLIAPTPVNQQFPSGVWTGPQSAPYQANNVWGNDPYFKNTTLLLHGDGATTPFIKDASTNNFQITLNGDTKPNNLTPFITNGYWSNYFDGASYLQVAYNAALDASTGPFTYECWLNPSTTTNKQYLGGSVTNAFFAFVGSGTIFVGRNNVAVDFTSSATIVTNQWNHVVIVRNSSNNIAIFINGSSAYYAASNTNNYGLASNPLRIGVATTGSSYEYNGYISNVRIAKSALYDPTASTITVPTAPLTAGSAGLLTCQSNRFVDNSSNAFAITTSGSPSVSMQQPFTAPSGTSLYGSGYFDGTGDSLTSSNNSAFNLGSNNFTVEAWVYVTATPGGSGAAIIGKNSATYPGGYEFNFVVDTGRTIFFGAYTTTLVSLQGAIVTSLNSWNHVAAVRSGSNWALFVNGVRDVTATASGTVQTTTSSLYVGDYGGGSRNLTGYISNVRLVNGSAIYDPTVSTLTVPTAPLTPVTNTSLLTLQTNGPATNNGFLDSSYNSAPIARNGNVAQGSFNPYQTTGYWSNYFDGSGDYLTIPSSSTFSFTGSFTWEAWVYLPVTTSGAEIVSKHVSGVTGWYMLAINSSLNVNFVIWDSSNNASNATTSGAVTLGAWNHIAGGRNGSTVFACLNGVYTSAALTVTPRTSDAIVNIGINANGSASPFNGYISNLRAVSAAVYTGNYTVPTAPLTAIASTQLLTCQSNRFKDNSSNAVALTSTGNTSVQIYQPFTLPALQYTPRVFGGSAYFDGSGDYLTLPANTGLLGSNDFSLEAWVYPFSSGNQVLINGQTDHNTAAGSSYSFNINQTPAVFIGGSAYTLNGAYPQVYAWSHVVFCRTGGTLSTFLNGVRVSTRSDLGTGAVNNGSTSYPPAIGANGSFDLYTGYICDARKIIGSGGYNATLSTLTVPTAPLTVTATTNMLVSMTNAAIFDNSSMNNMETAGDAKVSTAVTKYGTSSMYFDGSGDYLLPVASPSLILGAVNFTVECWVNIVSSTSTYNEILDWRKSGNSNAIALIYTSSALKVYNAISATYIISGPTAALNTWYHVAIVRLNGVVSMYINGVSVGTASLSSNLTSDQVNIGRYYGGSDYYNGYIDDLRITPGVARYVGNFTPPVARMPNQ